mgnify:CR=1 FL=1
MQNPPEADRLKDRLRALPQPCTVLVSASHASHFKPAPKDGHAYIVQDPVRPWVQRIRSMSALSSSMGAGSPSRCDTAEGAKGAQPP